MAAFPLIAFGLFSKKKAKFAALRSVTAKGSVAFCVTSCIADSAEAGRAACSVLLPQPVKPCGGFGAKGGGTSTLELRAFCRAPPEHVYTAKAKHRICLILQDDYMIRRRTPGDNDNLFREG